MIMEDETFHVGFIKSTTNLFVFCLSKFLNFFKTFSVFVFGKQIFPSFSLLLLEFFHITRSVSRKCTKIFSLISLLQNYEIHHFLSFCYGIPFILLHCNLHKIQFCKFQVLFQIVAIF